MFNASTSSHLQRLPLGWSVACWAALVAASLGCAAHTGKVPADASSVSRDVNSELLTSEEGSEWKSAEVPDASSSSARSVPERQWLDSRSVASAVRPHHGAFTTCHRLAGGDHVEKAGAVRVGWLVQPSGTIEEAYLHHSTFPTEHIGECVLSVAQKVRFPASQSVSEVSWTVRFTGSTGQRLARFEAD